jgi:predicted transcriptional regulator
LPCNDNVVENIISKEEATELSEMAEMEGRDLANAIHKFKERNNLIEASKPGELQLF